MQPDRGAARCSTAARECLESQASKRSVDSGDSMTGYELPAPSARSRGLNDAMVAFMQERVLPAEAAYLAHRRSAGPHGHEVPPVIEDLKAEARSRGLWNLFLPSESGLTQLEYAPIAELSGWSNDLAPEAINCQAPDTGNMELLHLLGS